MDRYIDNSYALAFILNSVNTSMNFIDIVNVYTKTLCLTDYILYSELVQEILSRHTSQEIQKIVIDISKENPNILEKIENTLQIIEGGN